MGLTLYIVTATPYVFAKEIYDHSISLSADRGRRAIKEKSTVWETYKLTSLTYVPKFWQNSF